MKKNISLSVRVLLVVGVCTLLLAGCGSKNVRESFFRQDVDLGFIETVAVLPFENNSNDKFAGERLRDITITHVLARQIFDVMDKGIVDNALKEEAIDMRTPLGSTSLKRLAQVLGVQAFLLGTIDQIEEGRKGNYTCPRIALTYRLVEANTGTILWQASGSRSGDSLGGRLFGLEPEDNFQVARGLADELLVTLAAASRDTSGPPATAAPGGK